MTSRNNSAKRRKSVQNSKKRKPQSRSRSKSASKNDKVVRSNPKLWEQIKKKWLRSSKAGSPYQWTARKAQLAVQEYKRRGGKYKTPYSRSNSLAEWSRNN